ncbi:dihydroneopterin aldolase [Methylonatrum kenyense]|nr:dihydroneopterin aldolase [Methylonatrum kenyense]MCK8515397.1 dihydroneopterin aldolase [Methylonatrum kenyense]
MDIVRISALRVEAVIGVHAWEQRIRQPLVFDLDMGTDIRPAANDDDLGRTLDYAAISERIRALVASSRYALIETLAERVVAAIRDEFGVAWLRLELRKPGAVGGAQHVAVIIERGQR